MLEITLKQLEAFVCVADCGSFFEASQRLFVSQPTVSSHIAALEAHFHTTLLSRGSRKKVTLTESGQAIYQRAKAILLSCRELEQAQAGQTTELCIGASTVPMGYILPPLLAAFQKQHPSCRFVLKKGDSAAVHEMLRSGSVQLGVVGTALDRERLIYQKLAQDQLVLLAPNTPEYQALAAKGVLGRELLDRPFIFRSAGSGTQRAVEQYLQAQGKDVPRLCVVAQAETNEAVIELTAQQMGLAILSSLPAAAAVKAGKVLAFPLEEAPVTRELFLAWPAKSPLPKLAKQFVEFVAQP